MKNEIRNEIAFEEARRCTENFSPLGDAFYIPKSGYWGLWMIPLYYPINGVLKLVPDGVGWDLDVYHLPYLEGKSLQIASFKNWVFQSTPPRGGD